MTGTPPSAFARDGADARQAVPRTVPIGSIVVGERDRSDLGNLDELAGSITAVGLLHPIVVNADSELVAGGRRLEALRILGWTDIPVTVANLENLADLLRAEADENACRKPLTPMEGSRARDRRTRLLAPKAAERKAHGLTAPGRSANAGSNLEPASSRKTRTAAAVGTGYSASTLDKVDEIRGIAERGVAVVGKGAERREIPVPAQVQLVAQEQIADLEKTSFAIEPAHKKVKGAIAEFIEGEVAGPNGSDLRIALRRDEFNKAMAAATAGLRALKEFSPEEVDYFLDENASRRERLAHLRNEYATWFATTTDRAAQLRVIGGGMQ